jgi:ribonucleoside-diphosphate reductase alpha chain
MENTKAVVIGSPIVKAEVVKEAVAAPLPQEPAALPETAERPSVLPAKVYKIKPGEHAYYITISDIVMNSGTDSEVVRPYEIFINTKDLRDFQWIAALSRMISAVMRKGGDLSFAIEELMATFDPAGGAWVDGTYVPSTVAYIGIVIEQHLRSLGLMEPKVVPEKASADSQQKGDYCSKCHSYSLIKEGGCLICKACGFSTCS